MIIQPDTSIVVLGAVSLVMILNTILWFSLVAVIFTHPKTRSVYNRYKGIITKSFGGMLVALGIKIALTHK